ncbi:YwqG family protein [Candidatus Riflebacteria bacterium]
MQQLEDLIKKYELNQLSEILNKIKMPCLYGNSNPCTATIGRSKLGGCPDLPQDFIWPEYNKSQLSFIAQIDLSETSHPLLPEKGIISFFYNNESWGFSPEDRGSARVFYFPDTSFLSRVETPIKKEKYFFGFFEREARVQEYTECGLEFEPGFSIPSFEHPLLAEHLSDDADIDRYLEMKEEFNPIAQVFGYPDPVQGDSMQLECEMVNNGIYCGDETGFLDPRVKELEKGKNDWLLLLQLTEDKNAQMYWGDAGILYFWIRKQDLANRNFANAWLIMQCC